MKKRVIIIIFLFAIVLIFIVLNKYKNNEKFPNENSNTLEAVSQVQDESEDKGIFTLPYKNDNMLPGIIINSATNGKYKEFEVKGTYSYTEKGISIILKHEDANPENKIGYHFEVEHGKITYDYSLNEPGIDETNVFIHSSNNSSDPMSPQYGVLWKTETPLTEKEFEITVDVRNLTKDQYLYTFFIKIINDNGDYYIDSIRTMGKKSDTNTELIEKSIKYLQDTDIYTTLNTNNTLVNELKGQGSIEYRTKDGINTLFNYNDGAYQIHIGTKENSRIKDVYVILSNDLEIIGFDYGITK